MELFCDAMISCQVLGVTEDPHLPETFMAVCEEKQDLSFICFVPAKWWRQAPGLLPWIFPWHS